MDHDYAYGMWIVAVFNVAEKRAMAEYGEDYSDYIRETPCSFFPPMNKWYELLTVKIPESERL